MSIDLTWRWSLSVSCLHAAGALLEGKPLADPRVAEVLRRPGKSLEGALREAGIPPAIYMAHLTALAAPMEGSRQATEVALCKTVGQGAVSHRLVEQLAAGLRELQSAYQTALPDRMQPLEARCEPLRLAWESRGPGVLRSVGRMTDGGLIVSSADVLVVQPALGGGGAAHLPYNSVRIEGLPSDPFPHLPEVVRLAWLLAQLNLDIPIYSETISAGNLPLIGALSMVPPVLEAAEQAGLTALGPCSLEQALEAWQLVVPDAPAVGQQLLAWWETYQASQPRWAVALAALEQMVLPRDRP